MGRDWLGVELVKFRVSIQLMLRVRVWVWFTVRVMVWVSLRALDLGLG